MIAKTRLRHGGNAEPRPANLRRRRWIARLGLACGILVAAVIGAGHSIRDIFADPPRTALGSDENFNEGVVFGRAQMSGLKPCRDGWCLGPGGSGSLTYWSVAPPSCDVSSRLGLGLWFYLPPAGHNSVEVSIDDGRSFRTLAKNINAVARTMLTDVPAAPGSRIAIRFSALNASPQEVLSLDKLVVLCYQAQPGESRRLVHDLSDRIHFFWVFLFVGLAAVPLSRSIGWTTVAVVILAWGAAVRLQELAVVRELVLDPDAQGYRVFAERMTLFTDKGFFSGNWGQREPLFIIAVKAFFGVVGSSNYHLRLFSFLLSVVAVGAVMSVATAMFGPAIGTLSGAVVALSEPLRQESSRGLRLEFEIVLLVLYWLVAFWWTWPRGWMRALTLGLYGGALSLLRSTYLPAVLILNCVALARPGHRPRKEVFARATLATVLTIAAVVPHRYGMYRHTGDPFFDTALYARWNANVEFAGRPGFPTLQQLQADAYIGPKLSYVDYLFGLHSVRELVAGTVRGFVKLFLNMDVRAAPVHGLNLALQVAAAAGFFLALRDRRFLWIPLSFALMELPIAFLYDRQLLERFRHTFSAFPLVVFAAALSLQRAWEPLARSISSLVTAMRRRTVGRGRGPL